VAGYCNRDGTALAQLLYVSAYMVSQKFAPPFDLTQYVDARDSSAVAPVTRYPGHT
jgi:hypothetical protein